MSEEKHSSILYTTYGAALGVALLTIVVFFPALQNGFVNWDDDLYVYENKNIRSRGFDLIKWGFTDTKVGHWHPLTWFSLAIDHAVWGLNPLGYHLTNIILHSLNTVMVFILTINLVKYGHYGESKQDKTAFITGVTTSILFGIHPLHVESVAWITERKDVLSLFFILICLLSYVRYISSEGLKKSIYYCACLILFIMSLMSKPMAISLPVILLILDFYPFKRITVGDDFRKIRLVLIEKVPFLALSILSAMITIWAAHSAGAMMKTPFTFVTRIIMAGGGLIFYLFKMIMPFNLAPLYPYPFKVDLFSIEYLGSFILFLIITFFCLRSRRSMFFIAVWLYYIVTLIPVIGVIQAGPQAAADRYTYLPSLGPFLLIGLGVDALFERLSKKQLRLIIIVTMSVLTALLATRTVRQINVWHDPITLWTHEISIIPASATAYQNRGASFSDRGDYKQALKDLDKAIELNPESSKAYINRGNIYTSLGNYQKAIMDLNKAIELNPRFAVTFYHRGQVYSKLGNYHAAIIDYSAAIGLNPDDIKAYNSRGNAYRNLKEYGLSIKDFNKGLELDPADAIIYNNRGIAYRDLKNYNLAVADYKKAIELNPTYAQPYYNLGLVYSIIGDDGLALTCFRKAANLGLKEAQEYLNKESVNK